MKIKKWICLVLSGMLMLALLSSCGKKNEYEKLLDSKSPVTITIWHYYNGVQQTQFDQMVAEFNDTVGVEKGIVVEAISQGSINELSDSVIAAVNKDVGADNMPDIFASYAETAYIVDEQGCVADLKKYFTEQELDEYVEDYIEEGKLGDEDALKIFPAAKSTEVLMINKTDWEKFATATGITYDDLSTWEGLVRVAESYYNYTDALTPDVKNDGKTFFGRDSVANYMNVGAAQLGAAFAAEDSEGNVKPQLDKEAVKRLWENYYVPYVKGYYKAENRYRSDDAKIGTIIALIGSTSGAVYFPDEVTIGDEYSYPIENVVLPVPNFEGCEPYAVQQGAGFVVTKSTTQKEYASVVFLKWFAEAERNIQFSVNSGYLPVKKEANDFNKIQKVSAEAGIEIDDTLEKTISVAIDEINSYKLYTSPAFDKSAQYRDYIGNTMQDTASRDCEAAWSEVAAGKDREEVLEKYTDDAAFEAWYAAFEEGFYQIGQ